LTPLAPARSGRPGRALDSFACKGADGQDSTVLAGSRLRRSHPAAVAHPEMFVADGLDDEEVSAVRRQRFPGVFFLHR